MFKILRQPFPRENTFGKHLLNALVSGILVTLFLRIFSPFGFASAHVQNLNLFALGYGLVTTAIIVIYAIFEFAFPKIFLEEKWTVGKNILTYLILIFLIGSANLFYTALVTQLRISVSTFLTFQFFTLSVTIVVVSAMTMLRYFKSLNFYQKEARVADDKVHQLKPTLDNSVITIKSENEKENLQLELNDLIYIESADNYSKVVFRKNNKVSSTLIRSSLKRLEDQLQQPELFRCHRTFIVQLRNVEKVTGNSQGYRLSLKHMQHSIPVSRRAGKLVVEKINSLINQLAD